MPKTCISLQRVWELHHRLLASESVTQHTLFREETRWPGYYYRGDHLKLDDANWHCFTTCPATTATPEVGDGEGDGPSSRGFFRPSASRVDVKVDVLFERRPLRREPDAEVSIAFIAESFEHEPALALAATSNFENA